MLTSIEQGPNQLKTGTHAQSPPRPGHGALRDVTANLGQQSGDGRDQRRGVWAGNQTSGLRTDVCYRPAVQPQAGRSPSLNPSFLLFEKAALDPLSEVTS